MEAVWLVFGKGEDGSPANIHRAFSPHARGIVNTLIWVFLNTLIWVFLNTLIWVFLNTLIWVSILPSHVGCFKSIRYPSSTVSDTLGQQYQIPFTAGHSDHSFILTIIHNIDV